MLWKSDGDYPAPYERGEAEELTWNWQENILFYGKIGADNLLLMLVGLLHMLIWLKKRHSGLKRMREELFEAVFFLGYGLLHDLYRFKAIRPFILSNRSFTLYNTIILVLLLLPLYVQLLSDIKALYHKPS